MTMTVRETAALNHLRRIVEASTPTESKDGTKILCMVPLTAINRAADVLHAVDMERAAAAPAAPVASEYVLVCQPNSAIKPTLEIKIYGHSAQSARASGITIGTMLFAVGYSRFGVFENGKLVSEFTLSQPDIVVK